MYCAHLWKCKDSIITAPLPSFHNSVNAKSRRIMTWDNWTSIFLPLLKTKLALHMVMCIKTFVLLVANEYILPLKRKGTLLNHHPYCSSSSGMLCGAVTKSSSATLPTWLGFLLLLGLVKRDIAHRFPKASQFFPCGFATLTVAVKAKKFKFFWGRSGRFLRCNSSALTFTPSFWIFGCFTLRLLWLTLSELLKFCSQTRKFFLHPWQPCAKHGKGSKGCLHQSSFNNAKVCLRTEQYLKFQYFTTWVGGSWGVAGLGVKVRPWPGVWFLSRWVVQPAQHLLPTVSRRQTILQIFQSEPKSLWFFFVELQFTSPSFNQTIKHWTLPLNEPWLRISSKAANERESWRLPAAKGLKAKIWYPRGKTDLEEKLVMKWREEMIQRAGPASNQLLTAGN